MSTLTKAEASRINGAKSRGPVTPEGKQRSSMNAVKHGLLAKSICLNIEKPEVFEELVAAFSTRLQPADEIEMRLVEQAAMAQFRYERIAASTETSMFVLKMDNQAPEVAKQYERVDPPTRFAIAFTALANEGNSIQLMLRYQQTMLRQRDSAIKQLHELRAKFPTACEPDAPVVETPLHSPINAQVEDPRNEALAFIGVHERLIETAPTLKIKQLHELRAVVETPVHSPVNAQVEDPRNDALAFIGVHERLIETAPTLKIKMPTLAGEHFHTPCSTRVMFMGESDSDGNATAKTCL